MLRHICFQELVGLSDSQPNLIYVKCLPGLSPPQQHLQKNRVTFSWRIWASWLPRVLVSLVSVADVGLVFLVNFLPFVT